MSFINTYKKSFLNLENLSLFGKETMFQTLFALLIAFSFFGDFIHPFMNSNRFFLFSFALFILVLIFKKFRVKRVPLPFWSYLGFAVLTFISFLYSYDKALTLIEFRNIVVVTIVFFSVFFFATTKIRIVKLINIYLALSVVYGIFLIFKAGIFQLGSSLSLEEKSYNIIIIEFLLSVILCFVASRLSGNKIKYFLIGLFSVLIIIATGSVKGFIAVAFFIILGLWPKKIKVPRRISFRISRKTLFIRILILFLLSGVGYFLAQGFLDKGLGRSISTIMFLVTKNAEFGSEAAGSVKGMRSSLIESGIKYWEHRPVFGSGINNYRYHFAKEYGVSTYSHSTPIELLVGTGIIGFMLYYLFVIGTLFLFIKNYLKTNSSLFLIMFFGLSAFVVISFGQRMYANFYQFFFIALMLALSNTILKEEKSLSSSKEY